MIRSHLLSVIRLQLIIENKNTHWLVYKSLKKEQIPPILMPFWHFILQIDDLEDDPDSVYEKTSITKGRQEVLLGEQSQRADNK